MTSSRKFERLLQAGCLGLIGMLAAAGCGGSSSPGPQKDAGDGGASTSEGGVSPAMLTVNPPSIDFQTIDVGVKSAPLPVTVTNSGNTASGPLTVTVSGTGITATGCSGQTLAKGATCTISVTAQLAAAGQFTGTIEVGDTALNTRKINVSGIAVPPGQFTLAPAPFDLGPVLAGKTATGTVVMTNIGTTGLADIVTNVSGTGFVAGTGTCTDALALGATCNIVINFTAGATSGLAKGTLTVSQGGVTKSVALTAMVQLPAKLVMTPPSAALQTVVGTPSQPATFYVTNAGDLASAVPTVTITGTSKDEFKYETTCVTALAGGATASCQVSVVYNPTTAPTTNSTATLTVSEGGATGSSVTAALTGTAVPPSTLVISGTPVDLGEVVVGNTGAASTFTVTNNGGENSGVVEVTAAPGQFIIVANSCADKDLTPKGTPAATNTCTFTAAFKPAAGDAGVIAGQLKAKGATTLNPAFLAVSGKAVPAAKLVIDPLRLDFSALPTGQESAPKTLVVSNQGGAPTGALRVENTGAQFTIKGDTCSNVSLTAAGATATCSIVVTFTSTGTDVEATGSIIVTDMTGAAGSVSASLHGTGTKHAGLAMVPSVVCPQYVADDNLCYQSKVTLSDSRVPANDWNFDNKVVGQTTAEKTIKVYNLTDPTLAPDSGAMKFEITGDAKGDFKIVQNNCTTLLSTTLGTSCVLTVTFTPSAVGLRTATLALSTDRGGASQTTLEGKGLAAVELQPLAISKTLTGLDFGGVALGHNGGAATMRPYRVWVRDTTAADHTSTVTVTLPTPSLPDFVWPTSAGTLTIKNGDNLLTPTLGHDGGAFVASPATAPAVANDTFTASASSNPCNNRTLDLSSAASSQNGYTKADGYWFCDFGVQFFPQSAKGDLSAELNATATGGGASKLTLTGKSTGPLVVTSVPENFILEPVAVGMSSTITLTITNQGITNQTNLTFALSGTGAADFQIIGTDCWGAATAYVSPGHAYTDLPAVTLLPGEAHACHVTLGFTPQTEDKYSVVFSATAANGAGTTDDEVGTGTITSAGSKKYGTLTVTPASATTLFGDVAAGSTTAPAVTFTVTNTGTLNATNLKIEKKGATAHFEVLPSTGVSGACNYENSSFILQGGVPCTVRIRPLPVAADAPTGVEKKLVDDKYEFSAEFNGQTVGVDVPVSYYVTSNIMVKDTGASSTSIAYEFAAAGQNAKVTHDFVVTNIGSTVANLATSVPSPFEVIAAGDGLTPPACTYGSATLAAGASCTLRLRNLNTTVSTVVPTDGGALKISDGASATYYAQVLLTSTTLQPSTLVNLEPAAGASIDLGTVPISSSTASFAGGVAKVWFKNTGKVATEALSFRWDLSTPSVTTGTAGTADPEFIIDSDETSCVNKVLQPDATCSMSVHFTPNYAQRANYQVRTIALALTNSGVDTIVNFQAKPSLTASLYFEDVTAGKEGFSQFPGSTALTALSTARTFRITNASGSDVALNLPAAGAALAGDFYLAATQPAGSCTLGAAQTLSTATTTSCTIDVQFKAPATMPTGNISKAVYSIGTLGAGETLNNSTYAALGLMARVQQPVALTITQTPSSVAAIGVGASTTLSLTVVNTGDVAMTGDPLTTELVAGVAAAGFAISADGCVGKRLPAGGSCVVGVTATGASLGSGTATLNVAIGASVTPKLMTVPVQNAAAISFKSGSGTFGSVPVTGMSADRTFVIQNAASAVRTGKVTAELTGTNADQFNIVGTTCLESGLAAAGECNVVVRFAPTALSTGDDFTATLTVTATPGGSKTMTLLGTPVSALAIDPSVATGSVAVGADAGKAFRVTLRDTATPTAPLKTSLSGTDFMMVADGCYGQILSSANTSCDISVKYIGTTSSTAKTTTLTVNGGSTAKTVSVSVSATNVQANTL